MRRAAAREPLTDAQRAVTEQHLKFCGRAANRFAAKYRHISRDAFLSAAFDGLADAVRVYDEDRGIAMECYARNWIKGACFDLLRQERVGIVRVLRRARGEQLRRVVSLDAPDPDTGRPLSDLIPDRDPDEPAFSTEDLARLARSLGRLDLEDRVMLARRYGLDGRPAEARKDIARRRSVSRETVRLDERAALAKLRRIFEGPIQAPPPMTMREAYQKGQVMRAERRNAG